MCPEWSTNAVSILYTARRLSRALAEGDKTIEGTDRSSHCAFWVPSADQSRSVGMVLEEDRQEKCPVVDFYGGEQAVFMITPLPGAIEL